MDQLYNPRDTVRNLKMLNESKPQGSKIIGESGQSFNFAHALGAPFIFPTNDASKWFTVGSGLSIAQGAQPYWGGTLDLTNEGGEGAFVYQFEDGYKLDLTQFEDGHVSFYFSTEDDIERLEFNLTSYADLNTFDLGFLRFAMAIPEEYVPGELFKVVISLADFEFASVNNGIMDASNMIGLSIAMGSGGGTVSLSGIHIKNTKGTTNVDPWEDIVSA